MHIPADEYNAIVKAVKQSDSYLNERLWQYTTAHLHRGIDKVYGKAKPGTPAFETAVKMKHNTARFAAYKTAHQVKDIRQSVNPQALNDQYNQRWMTTEYVHSVRAARMAKQWQQFQRDKDIYPYLRYMPSTAAEPRNEHKRLYNLTKPVDDPFWDTWLPPNDWGCKCSVEQTDRPGEYTQPPDDLKPPPAVMRNNPAKTGQLFTDGHPMIKRVSETARKGIEKEFDSLYSRKTATDVLNWVKKHLAGKLIKVKDKPDFKITIRHAKEILIKPAKKRWLRNLILQHIEYFYKKAIFVKSINENKGRKKYKYWYYYKVEILGETYYMNIVMLANGEKRLHAVTDSIK